MRPEKKMAFVGFWPVTRDMAPFGDPAWEIWGCNHNAPYLPKAEGERWSSRWNGWIDIHDPAWTKAHLGMQQNGKVDPSVWADMDAFLRTSHGKPIYMQRHYDEYPDSVPFPREEIQRAFGVTEDGRRYFTNALAYFISLALLQGATEIAIYGADMRHDEEYATQRPCVEYWLGRAQGMGVKVSIPQESGLLNADGLDYGFDEDTNAWVEMRRAVEERLRAAVAERDKHLAHVQTWDGVVQENTEWLRRIDQRRRGGGIL